MILLIRHPPVDASGRCYGRLDLPPGDVTPLAARLAGFPGTIWTSPAQRCRRVAEAAGPHRIDGRLQELDFGAWEGQPWDAIPRDALDRWAADPLGFSPPGGETGAALIARVMAFHHALPPGDHAIVTHGGPLKVLIPLLRGYPVDLLAPAPPPGSVTTIE